MFSRPAYLKFSASEINSPADNCLANLDVNGITTAYAGRWKVVVTQNEEFDWDKYSKAWHRSHGPAVTIDNRRVTFIARHGRGFRKINVAVDGWRGNWLANSIIEAGMAPKKPKGTLKLRLNKAYDVKKLDAARGYTTYSRTLLGQHMDYVIESPDGTVYHDDDRRKLLSGVARKRRAASRKASGNYVDIKLARKLRFCEAGIKDFASICSLDSRRYYTPKEIEKRIVEVGVSAVAQYETELRTLANALDYRPTMIEL